MNPLGLIVYYGGRVRVVEGSVPVGVGVDVEVLDEEELTPSLPPHRCRVPLATA